MTNGQKKIKTFNFWEYKKTISNIEQAKSNPRNSVIINNNKNFQKKKFYKTTSSAMKQKNNPNLNFKKQTRVSFQKRYF